MHASRTIGSLAPGQEGWTSPARFERVTTAAGRINSVVFSAAGGNPIGTTATQAIVAHNAAAGTGNAPILVEFRDYNGGLLASN